MTASNSASAHFQYTVVIERDGDGYSAYFPDAPGCFTQGDTLDEVRANAREALELYLQVLRDKGEAVPPPSALTEKISVKAS